MIKSSLSYYSKNDYLTAREANKVTANTETGARAGSDRHAWHVCVEDAEGSSSREGNEKHFIEIEGFFRDCVRRDSNHESLDQILNGTLYEFTQVQHSIDFLKHYK